MLAQADDAGAASGGQGGSRGERGPFLGAPTGTPLRPPRRWTGNHARAVGACLVLRARRVLARVYKLTRVLLLCSLVRVFGVGLVSQEETGDA